MKAALVGHGITKSLTPIMHMEEAHHQGFDYQYDVIDTQTPAHQDRKLSDIVNQARADGLSGLNVTHPFKLEAAKIADNLFGSARELQTVNTLVFDGDKVMGHNTDYVGFRSSLRKFLPASDLREVVLFGAGGAGRSVALALIDQGTRHLTIIDKNTHQAIQLKQLIELHRPNASVRFASSSDDLDLRKGSGFVNATPVGMADHAGSVLDVAKIRRSAWISELVYLPSETLLLKHARMGGNRTMNGIGMAVYQAVAAFRLLTSKQADPDRMLATCKASLTPQSGDLEAHRA